MNMLERRSELLEIIKRAEIELVELDRPRMIGRDCYYDIIDDCISPGKWSIPSRSFIPKEHWNKIVSTRTICWMNQEN